MVSIQLTSNEMKDITLRLEELTSKDTGLSSSAYSEMENSDRRCGCKGSCEGGCTSW